MTPSHLTEIKRQAEEYQLNYFATVKEGTALQPKDHFLAGYNLACGEIKKRDEEIERLNGLIEKAFVESYNNTWHKSTVDKNWQQFKTENNL